MPILGDKLFVNIFMKSIQNFETVLACSYGAQAEYFIKKVSKISWHFPFDTDISFICVRKYLSKKSIMIQAVDLYNNVSKGYKRPDIT